MRFESRDYEILTRTRYQSKTLAHSYWNEYAGKFKLSSLPARLIAIREQLCIANALAKCRPHTVFDIPCGTGKLAKVLHSTASHIVGGDISIEMMELAKPYYTNSPPFSGAICCDAVQLPFARASYDCVICLRLLHRTPDEIRKRIIAELSRITKQYVIISCGVVDKFQNFRLNLKYKLTRNISVPYPVTYDVICEELKECGLDLIAEYKILPFMSSEQLLLLRRHTVN